MQEVPQIQHAALTDVGVKRSHNQDAYAVQTAGDVEMWVKAGHIFLVADGMGGHAVGEKASAKAADDIPHTYRKYASDGVTQALRRAFLEANAGIHAIGQENPEFRGLGTTATALVIRPDGAWLGHVGDSRAYRIRGKNVEQLTYDHSLLWELARREGVDPDDLPDIKRNVIVRSLGPDALVQVDVEGPHPLREGDAFLLCSDGLSNLVREEELGAIIEALDPEEACRFLIELTNLRGGPDNTTAIVVRLDEVGEIPKKDRVSPWKAAWDTWNQRVPWPLTVLMAGFIFAITFMVAATNNWPGQSLLFAIAGMLTGIGIVGLIREVLKPKSTFVRLPRKPGEPNVYRRHPFSIDKKLFDKFMGLCEQLRQHTRQRKWPVDQDAIEKHHVAALELSQQGDHPSAFREACRALSILAACYNKHRQKEEAFQPRWDTAPTG